ncbi:hypothetical protein [Pseudoduganella sp. R-34]|uniref:hypothetical protein n=1 Tax=unclassified Pseudoduganella TaxID=2637179 RepID=UPI003CF25CDA
MKKNLKQRVSRWKRCVAVVITIGACDVYAVESGYVGRDYSKLYTECEVLQTGMVVNGGSQFHIAQCKASQGPSGKLRIWRVDSLPVKGREVVIVTAEVVLPWRKVRPVEYQFVDCKLKGQQDYQVAGFVHPYDRRWSNALYYFDPARSDLKQIPSSAIADCIFPEG